MNATKKFAASIIILAAASIFTIPALIKDTKIGNSGSYGNADFVLYYGSTCPHCKNVEIFIADNNLSEKLAIAQKEVYNDQNNQNEFVKSAAVCGLDTTNLGVPMLFDVRNSKCYTGDQPIIDFLKRKGW